MSIYQLSNDELIAINPTTFVNENILERKNLQNAIKNNFQIIDQECLIIAEELSEWEDSKKRIDLLAIDKAANLVVIELKRTESGEHMELQAIRYASMISTLTYQRMIEIYQSYLNKYNINENAENKILKFLEWENAEEDKFALDTRIILISQGFSREITTAVLWLSERDLDIKCIKIQPYNFNNNIFIDIQQIIPLPESENYQVQIKQQSEERREARKYQKDYSKYRFDNCVYNKRKLVFTVIKKWIRDNNPQNLPELTNKFPQDLHSGNLFEKYDNVINSNRSNRFFIENDEIINFANNEQYVISNQWGANNFNNFIDHVKQHITNYQIEKILETV